MLCVDENRGDGGFKTERAVEGLRERIVLIAGQQAVYQCLSQAIQNRMPDFEVIMVDRLAPQACSDHSVRLVLMASPVWKSIENVSECKKKYPTAAICLLLENGAGRLGLDRHLVQGLLPLSLPLEVCLAVLSLLLSGGEYLSLDSGEDRPVEHDLEPHPRATDLGAKAVRSAQELPMGDMVKLEQKSGAVAKNDASAHRIAALTNREREILQLISEVYQNKLIANRMSLSEHTVKAHVHNLIAKLRVTNRTQAAAFLHQRRQMHLAQDPFRGAAMPTH
jgi:DNA-binding NarL/FixJ family response regulator